MEWSLVWTYPNRYRCVGLQFSQYMNRFLFNQFITLSMSFRTSEFGSRTVVSRSNMVKMTVFSGRNYHGLLMVQENPLVWEISGMLSSLKNSFHCTWMPSDHIHVPCTQFGRTRAMPCDERTSVNSNPAVMILFCGGNNAIEWLGTVNWEHYITHWERNQHDR